MFPLFVPVYLRYALLCILRCLDNLLGREYFFYVNDTPLMNSTKCLPVTLKELRIYCSSKALTHATNMTLNEEESLTSAFYNNDKMWQIYTS